MDRISSEYDNKGTTVVDINEHQVIWGLFLAIRHYRVIICDEKYQVDNDQCQQLDHLH